MSKYKFRAIAVTDLDAGHNGHFHQRRTRHGHASGQGSVFDPCR